MGDLYFYLGDVKIFSGVDEKLSEKFQNLIVMSKLLGYEINYSSFCGGGICTSIELKKQKKDRKMLRLHYNVKHVVYKIEWSDGFKPKKNINVGLKKRNEEYKFLDFLDKIISEL